MFTGDIKSNLDPLGAHDATKLWHVLSEVGLADTVRSSGGLSAPVNEEGVNWSQGQRQLICIARALLKNSKLVMLDEATASCDVHTDQLVQRVIRRVFRECTVSLAGSLHTYL